LLAVSVAVTFALVLPLGAHAASFCQETPTTSASMSYGTPAKGRVAGAEKFIDSPAARVLPDRHRARCLWTLHCTSRATRRPTTITCTCGFAARP